MIGKLPGNSRAWHIRRAVMALLLGNSFAPLAYSADMPTSPDSAAGAVPISPSAAGGVASAPATAPTSKLPVLSPFDHRYDTSWGGVGIGQVEVKLAAQDKPGCYRYDTLSHPIALVASLYGSPNETSLFCLDDNGQVRSQHFASVLPGDDKQTYTLDFDWAQHLVKDKDGQTRPMPDNAIDSFALQQAVRLWVIAHAGEEHPPLAEFTMIDRKNQTHYQFKLAGHETVQTPAGPFETLRLDRVDNPDKIGRFWLAPRLDYMPVVIETKNGGKPMVRMALVR
jgi:hypothetical protein